DRGLELDAETALAVRIVDGPGDGATEFDRPRDALQGQLAVDDEICALATDASRLESQLRVALRVEELRREQMCRQVLGRRRDALDRRAADELLAAEDGLEVGQRAAERADAHVLDSEADRRVNGVGLPDSGRDGLDCFCDAHLVGLLPTGYT